MTNNPLIVLSLNETDALSLNKLTLEQKKNAMSKLRQFYALLYHPDRQGTSAYFAQINAAIDMAETQPLRIEVQKKNDYTADLQADITYWKNRALSTTTDLEFYKTQLAKEQKIHSPPVAKCPRPILTTDERIIALQYRLKNRDETMLLQIKESNDRKEEWTQAHLRYVNILREIIFFNRYHWIKYYGVPFYRLRDIKDENDKDKAHPAITIYKNYRLQSRGSDIGELFTFISPRCWGTIGTRVFGSGDKTTKNIDRLFAMLQDNYRHFEEIEEMHPVVVNGHQYTIMPKVTLIKSKIRNSGRKGRIIVLPESTSPTQPMAQSLDNKTLPADTVKGNAL